MLYSDQVKRVIDKVDTLVDSGRRMQLDSRDAMRKLREAEAETIRQRRATRKQSPFLYFLRLLFH